MNVVLKMAIHTSEKRQKQIAAAAGLKEPRLSKIVNGHATATPDEQDAIATALKKSREELFGAVAAAETQVEHDRRSYTDRRARADRRMAAAS